MSSIGPLVTSSVRVKSTAVPGTTLPDVPLVFVTTTFWTRSSVDEHGFSTFAFWSASTQPRFTSGPTASASTVASYSYVCVPSASVPTVQVRS
jgi:hypothetical protein